MALTVHKGGIKEMIRRAESAIKTGDKLKHKTEKMVHRGVRTMVVGGVSFGLGTINGRFGAVDVLGVPLDLGLAVGAHLVGFTGVAGSATEHAHSVGDAALASYMAKAGHRAGKAWRVKAGKTPLMEGLFNGGKQIETGGGGVSEDEQLAALAR